MEFNIEPLAFLAIMALYIEFPSVQDLIYTKICLEVVANYPNISSTKLQPKSHLTSSTMHELGVQNETIVDYSSRAHFTCDRLNKTAIPKEVRQEIAANDSLFWLKYQFILCLLCALSSPYWGGMSDRIGRLIPLNVPIFMATLSNIISLIFGLLISLNSHSLFRIEWLYLGAVLIGISGGQAVVIVSSFSFLSDNSSNESRSKRVAILESVIYLSHSFGFYITKHIMSLGLASFGQPWFNRHIVAFSTCILLNLICILYSLLKLRHHKFHRFLNNFEREHQELSAEGIVANSSSATGGSLGRIDSCNSVINAAPESSFKNSDSRQRELTSSTPDDLDGPIARLDKSWADWGAILTFEYYKQTYATTMKRRDSRSIILLLLLSGFISSMSLAILMSLLYIYLHMDPFNWTTSQYSSWNSITSITRGVALVCLTLSMKFIKGWNVPDPFVAAIGFLSKGFGLILIAIAQSSALINWALLAFVLSEFSMPPIRSLLSKLVVREEVGKIYSCLAAVQSICFLFGNVIFYLAYTSLDLQDFFRMSFLVVACFQLAAVVLMLIIYYTLRRKVISLVVY